MDSIEHTMGLAEIREAITEDQALFENLSPEVKYRTEVLLNNQALKNLMFGDNYTPEELEDYEDATRWLNLFVIHGQQSVVDMFKNSVTPLFVPERTQDEPLQLREVSELTSWGRGDMSSVASTSLGRVFQNPEGLEVYKGYLFTNDSPVYFWAPLQDKKAPDTPVKALTHIETKALPVKDMQSSCCGLTWVLTVDPDMNMFVGSLFDPQLCHSGRLTFPFLKGATRWHQAFLITKESETELEIQYAYCPPKSLTVFHRTMVVSFTRFRKETAGKATATVHSTQTITNRRTFYTHEKTVALLYSVQGKLLILCQQTIRTISTACAPKAGERKSFAYRLPQKVCAAVLIGEFIPGCFCIVAKSPAKSAYTLITVDLEGNTCHAECIVSDDLNQLVTQHWRLSNPHAIHRMNP